MITKTQLQEIQDARRHYLADDYAAAYPLARRAVNDAPDSGDLWLAYADSAYETGHYDEVLPALEHVMALGSHVPRSSVYYLAAATCARLGDHQAALDWYAQAVNNQLRQRSLALRDEAFAALHDDPRLLALCGRATTPAPDPVTGWRSDLAYLLQELERLHVHGSALVTRPDVQAAAQTLHDAIPDLSPAQIMERLQAILVLAGDGHTTFYPISTPRLSVKLLPIHCYWFEDGLHVVGGIDSAWLGARLDQIGPLKAEDLLTRLQAICPRDNPVTVRWIGPMFLRMLPFLQAWGATDSLDRATLTLRRVDGTTAALTLEGVEVTSPEVDRLAPHPASTPPLFLQNLSAHYWMTRLMEPNTLYVQYNQVRNMADESIAQFAERLQMTVQEQPPAALIVDVRLNNGGNNFLNAPLLHTLIWLNRQHPSTRLFVIIGRATFSACQNFVNLISRHTDAVFVGEPTGSRLVFEGESTELVLPYSGLRGSISCYRWVDTWPFDERQWVAPMVPVGYSVQDYLSNHDPALAAILTLL